MMCCSAPRTILPSGRSNLFRHATSLQKMLFIIGYYTIIQIRAVVLIFLGRFFRQITVPERIVCEPVQYSDRTGIPYVPAEGK